MGLPGLVPKGGVRTTARTAAGLPRLSDDSQCSVPTHRNETAMNEATDLISAPRQSQALSIPSPGTQRRGTPGRPLSLGLRTRKKLLTYSYIGIYGLVMARAATTSDTFNAVAEPRRQRFAVFLASIERQVGKIMTNSPTGSAVRLKAPTLTLAERWAGAFAGVTGGTGFQGAPTPKASTRTSGRERLSSSGSTNCCA